MPIVNDYKHVSDIYSEAGEKNVSLPAFCLEDRETLEAILAAALEIGNSIGNCAIPIIVSWTARYPLYSQAIYTSKTRNARIGCHLNFSDLEIFMSDESPYRDLLVLPNLHHAIPWIDGVIMMDFHLQFASIMCDASEKPFDENIQITAEFVEKVNRKVLVEGAVNEISSPELGVIPIKTTVKDAQRFIQETGVDLIVPNVGTEHRADTSKAHYDSELTRRITDVVGKKVCLHGSSSLKKSDLPKITEDGVIKVNLYTGIAREAGKAVTYQELENIGNVLAQKELQKLIDQDILGKAVLDENYGKTIPPIGSKLSNLTSTFRREVWFEKFKDICKDYMTAFNYHNFAK